MGCTQSQRVGVVSEPLEKIVAAPETIEDHVEDFLDFLTTARPYPDVDSSLHIAALAMRLKTHCKTPTACIKTIHYLTGLAQQEDAFRVFNTALLLYEGTDRIWHLNNDSLLFFANLHDADEHFFNTLLDEIKYCCTTRDVSLQTDHLDTVIASFNKQRSLPPHVLTLMDECLKSRIPSAEHIKDTLSRLSQTYFTRIRKQAKDLHLLHHDVAHALEIKSRTKQTIFQALELPMAETPLKQFLQQLIGFLIQFHDLVQGNQPHAKNAEQATALTLCRDISDNLFIIEAPLMNQCIEFIADRLIVLGTTMVFSTQSTMDLSELFFLIENAARRVGWSLLDDSNAQFLQIINIAMLITGVCDKNPVTMRSVVRCQADDEAMVTLPLIKKQLSHPSLLEQFFSTEHFSTYFSYPRLDQQAFLIALVPHLCMRAELSVKKAPKEAEAFMRLVSVLKNHYFNPTKQSFKSVLDTTLRPQNLRNILNKFFFSAIDSEITFSRSQIAGLRFANQTLHALFREIDPANQLDATIIDATIPEIDSMNLLALREFYVTLTPVEQTQLSEEMLLAVVFQAGTLYQEKSQLSHLMKSHSDSSTPAIVPIHTAARSTLFAKPTTPAGPLMSYTTLGDSRDSFDYKKAVY